MERLYYAGTPGAKQFLHKVLFPVGKRVFSSPLRERIKVRGDRGSSQKLDTTTQRRSLRPQAFV